MLLYFPLGGKFCFRSEAFSFVLGHATGIVQNVGRGGPVSFLLRHNGVNIARGIMSVGALAYLTFRLRSVSRDGF